MDTARIVLRSATITEFMYGRSVSRARSTKM